MGVETVVSADATEIAYRVSGTGPAVLLVHGAGTSGADWAFVARELRDRFTVATMDRRGRGGSGDGPAYAIDREAEDVLAVLDATGAELLVGHSYGAMCCVRAAERTGRLRRLVLYEPPISIPAEQQAAWAGMQAMVAAGERDVPLERFLGAVGATETQLALIRDSPAWPVLRDAVPALPRELEAAGAWRHPRPGSIAVPTLHLLGEDTTSPSYLAGLDGLAAAFTDLRREVLPGQQHLAHVFDPRAFAAVVAGFCA